ncbi:MAG: hypothetical protein KY438_07605 [Actinobacteria bacterium]|nr:hypothetical protein [Actinomycetota bacterium]
MGAGACRAPPASAEQPPTDRPLPHDDGLGRDDLASNFIVLFGQCERVVQERMIWHLYLIDDDFGNRVGDGIGINAADLGNNPPRQPSGSIITASSTSCDWARRRERREARGDDDRRRRGRQRFRGRARGQDRPAGDGSPVVDSAYSSRSRAGRVRGGTSPDRPSTSLRPACTSVPWWARASVRSPNVPVRPATATVTEKSSSGPASGRSAVRLSSTKR